MTPRVPSCTKMIGASRFDRCRVFLVGRMSEMGPRAEIPHLPRLSASPTKMSWSEWDLANKGELLWLDRTNYGLHQLLV